MHRLISISLLLLTACGEAHVQHVAHVTPDVVPDTPALSEADTTETVPSMVDVAHVIEALPVEQQAQAAESLRFLSVNCPYTRVALQLPFVLQKGVMDIDSDRISGAAQADWAALQTGLAKHVGVLDALNVQLPVPGPDDYLSQGLVVVPDRATLMASPHALTMTQTFVRAVPDLAQQTDTETRTLIEEHSARVETATGVIRQCPRGPWSVMPGHPWTLGEQLHEWHDALERVQASVDDPVSSEQIGTLIALLDDYEAATHAHVGAH
jgi:hypothetical protein